MSTEDKIEELLDLDDENFNKDFVEDIKKCLDAGWKLTTNQISAIDKIYYTFCERKKDRR